MKNTVVKTKSSVPSLEEEKNELAIKVLSLKDQGIVQEINSIIDELIPPVGKRTTIKQFNKEIEQAEKEIKAGNYTKHEDVVKGLNKLLNGKK